MIDTKIINLVLNSKYNQLSNNYKFESIKKNKICGDIINIRVSLNKKKILNMKLKAVFLLRHQPRYYLKIFQNMIFKNLMN